MRLRPNIKFIEYKNNKARYIVRYRYGDVFKGEFRDYRLPKWIWRRM